MVGLCHRTIKDMEELLNKCPIGSYVTYNPGFCKNTDKGIVTKIECDDRVIKGKIERRYYYEVYWIEFTELKNYNHLSGGWGKDQIVPYPVKQLRIWGVSGGKV